MLMLTTFYDMYAIHSFMAWNTYTIGAGTCYPSGAPEFIVCHFVLFLWSLNCLSFFLQLFITPHVLKTSSTLHQFTKTRQNTWSPSNKKSEQDDTISPEKTFVPLSKDTTHNSEIQNSDHHLKEKNTKLPIRPHSVHLHDILNFNYSQQHCIMSQCGVKNL